MAIGAPFGRPHPARPGRAALIGATTLSLVCVVFWATAAAHALPAGSPEFIRTFTPAAGLSRLVVGVFWTALIGALLSALVATAFNATRPHRHG